MANDRLNPNESLKEGEFRASANGQYKFILQEDGNLVLYEGSTSLWASNTSGKAASRCTMQTDGNLVLYGFPDALWASNTAGKPGSYLVVQNDGNVVIYRPNPIWATDTVQ